MNNCIAQRKIGPGPQQKRSSSREDVSSRRTEAKGSGRLELSNSGSDDRATLVPEPAPIVDDLGGGHLFVASSRAMREIRALASLVAQSNLSVLILGETGVGKEVVARLIHSLSARRSRHLLKVNCAALPGELLESELFGYEVGAFTGANRRQVGKFEACQNGTILLDEIAEMPAAPQAKLLHVLQDGSFYRLGSSAPIQANVRVLAATNVDIPRAIKTGKFREDLYYRLNAFSIHVPPLRERREDIPILVRHFVRHFSRQLGCEPVELSPDVLRACLRYTWPGNLRELENFVKRHLIVRDESKAIVQLEPLRRSSARSNETVSSSFSLRAADLKSLVRDLKRQAEQQAISATLEVTGGNRKETARRLNISTRALLYKIREYGIDVVRDTTENLQNASPHSAKSAAVGVGS